MGCSSLEQIKIPDSVTYMGRAVFKKCGNLKAVTLSKNFPRIRGQTFYECKNLQSVICGDIEKIGREAFWGARSLENFEFKPGLKKIGDAAFKWSGIKVAQLPESLEIIGTQAFSHCRRLKLVGMQDNVRYLGNRAFAECVSLRYVRLSSSLTQLAEELFFDCNYFTELNIPEGVEKICDRAVFMSRIDKLTVPKSVVEIGQDGISCPKIMKYDIKCKNFEFDLNYEYRFTTAMNLVTKEEKARREQEKEERKQLYDEQQQERREEYDKIVEKQTKKEKGPAF